MSLVATATRQWILPHRVRQSVLTAHVMVSVGLLGDSAGFLAVAIRTANTADAATVTELVEVLNMFSVVFGIPLSLGALVSGLALGLGGKWRVFRYPWVTAKLLLIVSVMLVGGLVIGPALTAMLNGTGDATPQLIVAATSRCPCALGRPHDPIRLQTGWTVSAQDDARLHLTAPSCPLPATVRPFSTSKTPVTSRARTSAIWRSAALSTSPNSIVRPFLTMM